MECGVNVSRNVVWRSCHATPTAVSGEDSNSEPLSRRRPAGWGSPQALQFEEPVCCPMLNPRTGQAGGRPSREK